MEIEKMQLAIIRMLRIIVFYIAWAIAALPQISTSSPRMKEAVGTVIGLPRDGARQRGGGRHRKVRSRSEAQGCSAAGARIAGARSEHKSGTWRASH